MSWFEGISILSFLTGLTGLTFGVIQYRGKLRTESVLQGQLASLLNRIRVMVPYKQELRGQLKEAEAQFVAEWCWSKYKGLSDLYVLIVTHYLSHQKRFTYGDLKRLVEARVIETQWEERVWRDLIALRADNKGAKIPEIFIKDNDLTKRAS